MNAFTYTHIVYSPTAYKKEGATLQWNQISQLNKYERKNDQRESFLFIVLVSRIELLYFPIIPSLN